MVGVHVHKQLHGENLLPRERAQRRISHGRVLEPRLRTWGKGCPIMRFLTTLTLHRCTNEGVAPKRLSLEIVGSEGRLWVRGTGVEPTSYEEPAQRPLAALWDAIAATEGDCETPVRLHITASQLVERPPRQGELFAREGGELQGVLDTSATDSAHARSRWEKVRRRTYALRPRSAPPRSAITLRATPQPRPIMPAYVGMMFEQAADIGLVRVELAGARAAEPGAEPGFVEPAAHRASVERDRVGDLGDGELLDAMQMLDTLEGGVIDHLVLAICCSTSLRRRAGALRCCVEVAGASSSERT